MAEKLALLGGKKVRKESFLRHPVMGKEEHKGVLEVLKSGLLSGFIADAGDSFLGGPKVRELEKQFAEYFRVKFAIAVNSGTAGLHSAIAAAGIGPGDEVIVSPYTMTASASCILMQNAIPVFVDIQNDIFCLDPNKVQEAITPRTKAILVVHLFGHPANMDPILLLAKKHNLVVIEDCAQAPGAVYKDKLVGTMGDIGVFSLNQHKTITTGEGGVIITNDGKLARKMQLIRNHGEVVVNDLNQNDIVNILGWNYRITELEAAIAIAQFQKLNGLTQWRVKLAEYLTAKLSEYSGIITPRIRPRSKHVYFAYPIRYLEDEVGIQRDLFVKAINAEGIPFGAGYVKPIYLEPLYQRKICYGKHGCPFSCSYYSGKVHYNKGLCPVAERLYEKELMITNLCRFPLKKEDMEDIIRAFEKIFDNIDKLKTMDD